MNWRRFVPLLVGMFALTSGTARAVEGEVAPLSSSIAEASQLFVQYGLAQGKTNVERAAVAAMVKAADPLGRFLSREEYEEHLRHQQGLVIALGIEIACTGGLPRVTAVTADTPAAECGIRAGDLIESIDDQDATNLPQTAVIDLVRGPITESVHLKVKRDDGSEQEWDIMRSAVPAPSIQAVETFPGGFGYIKLNGLYETDSQQIAEQLGTWDKEGLNGAILDLRRAGGTSVEAITRIANLFAQPGSLLLTLRDKDDQDLAVHKADKSPRIGLPLMVLIDEKTAGASETLAAVFRGSAMGAMLLGDTTRGDFIIREVIALSSGDYIYIATQQLALADGTTYTGDVGVEPHVVVKGDATPFSVRVTDDHKVNGDDKSDSELLRLRVRNDPALRRATDILLGLRALSIRSGEHTENTSR